MKTLHFFLDFDGTIATTDVVDMVLEKFADKKWRDVEREWQSGKIGSRECLTRQVELLKAEPGQIAELVSGVSLDPYFVPFIQKAEELGVLVTIVSDGFDLFIEQTLKKNLGPSSGYLKALPIFSNRLQPKPGGGFEVVFPSGPVCEHGCANCKEALIKRLISLDDQVLFVGDGLSDRYAAKIAHVTFAKAKLLDYCRDNSIDCIPYENFKKIKEWLTDNHAFLKKASFKQ